MDKNKETLDDIDFYLREAINTVKGGIDQVYFGILDYLEESEKSVFLERLKKQSDSLQDILYKSVVERARQVNILNKQLLEFNDELRILRDSLEYKVRERTKEIKNTQEVTIFALARLAESRDKETGEHLNRIRNYSLILAKYLGSETKYSEHIDKNFLHNIYNSSPLHDIGKVGITDAILLKPGKLTIDEFDLMKKHTIIGGQTLEDAERQLKTENKSFLTMGKEVAYSHHEKWDGSGYPFGLKETNIPLSARIVALADVYDALTSVRIYKPAYTHEESMEIIISGKCTHFDPYVVEAFTELENEFSLIKDDVYMFDITDTDFGGKY